MAELELATVHIAVEADAELLALVARYIAAIAEHKWILDLATDMEDDLNAEEERFVVACAAAEAAGTRADRLVAEIANLPALSLAGLRAKARAAEAWAGDLDECPIVNSLLDDLLQDSPGDARRGTPRAQSRAVAFPAGRAAPQRRGEGPDPRTHRACRSSGTRSASS